ncbi:hypothetical protein [Actinoalloteichus hymeniacidonis]|uniref:Uncharacterized protein n=1 Tax=Actinoalloteichus hymeniacidonis TaxID=340345 RepID=A0AAC9HLV0_9PSEU|nr:hypothetical protein [Actinoalloteichus hymeniacidonis]AOS61669.1 hypothetical protein TL08_04195 [Actinoalloteichus hymeniacidonis]MBB5910317.1 hypothetical protein [Actinoalloteichus hymeniacidonis]
MPYPASKPTFLPLTLAAVGTLPTAVEEPARPPATQMVRQSAEEADRAAADCWLGLLAGCDSPARRDLIGRLRVLFDALSSEAGRDHWRDSAHRLRVAEATSRVGDAVDEGDGAEFAEAINNYDQTVATAVVSLRIHLGSSTV